jgi:hypothetical protein
MNHILLRATDKNMKNIAANVIRPTEERKIAIFRPRFLRVMRKMPDTDKSAIKAKNAEKGI